MKLAREAGFMSLYTMKLARRALDERWTSWLDEPASSCKRGISDQSQAIMIMMMMIIMMMIIIIITCGFVLAGANNNNNINNNNLRIWEFQVSLLVIYSQSSVGD